MTSPSITSHLPRSVCLLKGLVHASVKTNSARSNLPLHLYRAGNIASTPSTRAAETASMPTPSISTSNPNAVELKAAILESRTRFSELRKVFTHSAEASVLPRPQPAMLMRSTSGKTCLPPALLPKPARIVTAIPARTDSAASPKNAAPNWPLTESKRTTFTLQQQEQTTAASGIYRAEPVQLDVDGERLIEPTLRHNDVRRLLTRFPTLHHLTTQLGSQT